MLPIYSALSSRRDPNGGFGLSFLRYAAKLRCFCRPWPLSARHKMSKADSRSPIPTVHELSLTVCDIQSSILNQPPSEPSTCGRTGSVGLHLYSTWNESCSACVFLPSAQLFPHPFAKSVPSEIIVDSSPMHPTTWQCTNNTINASPLFVLTSALGFYRKDSLDR